jgi:hypothetical protein
MARLLARVFVVVFACATWVTRLFCPSNPTRFRVGLADFDVNEHSRVARVQRGVALAHPLCLARTEESTPAKTFNEYCRSRNPNRDAKKEGMREDINVVY